MRPVTALIATALCALPLAACGSKSISVPESEAEAFAGAQIFAERCGGCHTISAAGTQGSGNRGLRVQGPNFDEREESYEEALFAIQNGGFGGAIMPQNIVVGEDAELVARFLEEYSGADVEEPARPTPTSEDSGPLSPPGQGGSLGGGEDEGGEAAGGAETGERDGPGAGENPAGTGPEGQN